MSYQFPPRQPPSHGGEMEMPPSGYGPGYGMDPAGDVVPLGMHPNHETSRKERKESFSQASQKLKRSVSTPNVRPQQANAADHVQLGLAGEKKRNKLGYHRTSVACGHCRRRKIRCIPATSDVQGRCLNCIRLKKDCSFFPVDQQQPPADARSSKAPSRASTGPGVTSASSSPALAPGHSSEGPPTNPPYPHIGMATAQQMAPPGIKAHAIEGFSPDGKVHPGAAARGFDFASQSMTNWMAPDASPGTAQRSIDPNAHWRSYSTYESPVTPSFSPYTPHAPPPATAWSASPSGDNTAAREDSTWPSYAPAPPRSMSFGNDGQGHSSHLHPIPQQGRQFGRKPTGMQSDVYPAPISTAIPAAVGNTSATALEHNGSMSAGAVEPAGYGAWQQGYPYSRQGESYGGSWEYGEQVANPPIQSQDQASSSGQQQPQSTDMYFPSR